MMIEEHDLLKIGWANVVEKRRIVLQTALPFNLQTVFYIKSDNHRLLEGVFHRGFADNRIRREWFQISRDGLGNKVREILLHSPIGFDQNSVFIDESIETSYSCEQNICTKIDADDLSVIEGKFSDTFKNYENISGTAINKNDLIDTELKKEIFDLLVKDENIGASKRKNRMLQLITFANDLSYLGYNNIRCVDINEKHILMIVSLWLSKNIKYRTIETRLVHVRWLAKSIGKPNIVYDNNSMYGLKRKHNTSSDIILANISSIEDIYSEFIKASLMLQWAFGLTIEESMKICIGSSIRRSNSHLWPELHINIPNLQSRNRVIDIRTKFQNECISQAKLISPFSSLIPSKETYSKYRKRFEYKIQKSKIDSEGLRYLYAKNRYAEITGFGCPIDDGDGIYIFGGYEKDLNARKMISEEMALETIRILDNYLGTWFEKSDRAYGKSA